MPTSRSEADADMKIPNIWFHDKDGKIDPLLTFTFFAVMVILFKLLFAGATLTISHFTWTVTAPDATVIGAAWSPTLVAYVANKYVNYNYHPDYVAMKKDLDGDGKDEEVLVKK